LYVYISSLSVKYFKRINSPKNYITKCIHILPGLGQWNKLPRDQKIPREVMENLLGEKERERERERERENLPKVQ
jgi:hypothetical protein